MTVWMNNILMLSSQGAQMPELFTFRVSGVNAVAMFELAM